MAIYDNLPYTNFHELNADWLLKQMKEAKAKIDEYQEVLDGFEEDYQVLLGLASALTVAGSNVTVAGSLTANGLIGNLTGNVTGNLNGNASTATHATSADSATTATSATTAGSATTATTATTANGLSGTASVNTTGTITASAFTGDLTGNVTGNLTGNVTGNLTGTATLTSNFTMRTDITSTDADDYVPNVDGMAVFKTVALTQHVPSSLVSEQCIILTILSTIGAVQMLWSPPTTASVYMRVKVGGTWQSWAQL